MKKMRINLFIVACVLLMGSCGKSKEELGNEVIIKVEKYKLKKEVCQIILMMLELRKL